MKKILGAALALSLIGSAAFAEVTVRGRGYLETDVFNFTKTQQDKDTSTSGTALFNNWDAGDTDIWVDGVFADGKAGGSMNITLKDGITSEVDSNGNVSSTDYGFGFGDWNLWIKPVDFFELRVSNEANRWVNRYNSIIDKLESKYGAFTAPGTSSDSDSLNGFMLNFDFDVVQFQLASTGVGNDWFVAGNAMDNSGDNGTPDNPSDDVAPRRNHKDFNFGARVAVPLEGIANFYGWYKLNYFGDEVVQQNDDNELAWVADYKAAHNFGIYADIVAVENLGIVIGYNGFMADASKVNTTLPSVYTELVEGVPETWANFSEFGGGAKDRALFNGIDLRVQYMLGNLGLALHNNITFAGLLDKDTVPDGFDASTTWIYDKVNLGVSYKVNDTFTAYLELGNQLSVTTAKASGDGMDMSATHIKDSIQIYPRVQINITENALIKTGLSMNFDVVNSESSELTFDGGSMSGDRDLYNTKMDIALPIALQVTF